MSSLYFLGIKKSIIKKTPPFKYLFDWRDRRNYKAILTGLQPKYKIESYGANESLLHFPLGNKTIKLIFRLFPASDLSVLNQVFEHKCYHPIIKRMQQSFANQDALKIIDAGGNVGYSCLFFQAFFPNAKIVAIEPEENNARQLKKNVSVNNFQLKQLVQGALWYNNTFLEVIRDFRDNREAAFTVQETKKQTGLRGYSFEEILQDQGWAEADLVKIDIEGGERFLFDTKEKADAILQRTKFLAIEIHDEFNIRNEIYAHLQRNGFDYFEFDDLTLAINKNKVQ